MGFWDIIGLGVLYGVGFEGLDIIFGGFNL